jgi:hypothetical protein
MILRKTFFTIAVFTYLLLISCSGDDEIKTDAAVPATSITPLLTPTDTQITVINTGAPQKNEGDVALNPQHGQPGHRCEIAVGAPLNSLPNAPNTPNTPFVTPPTTSATVPAITTSTAEVKFNPKHGEPGHRCELAVGAPLDGKKQ